MSRCSPVLCLSLAVLALCLVPLRDAHACGMFVPSLKTKAPPRMEQERTLIVWDASTQRQQFVREVRFTNTGELPFGFIVTTPTRPEVNEVKSAPFDALEARFPHTLLDTPDLHLGAPGGKGSDEGRGATAGRIAPVQVLEKKRIGDFTSFVLAATNAKALADWLKKNQFRATEAGEAWIHCYVKLGFFFVALRYEGKKAKAAGSEDLVSRSIRLSFDSALPYYPYEEPGDAPQQQGRELQVWLVTQGLHQPIAPVVSGGTVALYRPWSEGARYDASSAEIASAFGSDLAGLVPTGARVQTFGDWKEHRRGFGDLVLVPAQPEGCDARCVAARRPLMALLDPTPSPSSLTDAELVVPPPAPRAATTRSAQAQPPSIATGSPFGNSLTLGCGIARTSGAPGFGLVLMVGLGLARRARRRQSQLLFAAGVAAACAGCGMTRPPPPSEPPPPASVATTTEAPTGVVAGPGFVSPGKLDALTLPEDAAARSRAVMRLLAGHNDDKLIPVWSTPTARGIGHARRAPTNALGDPAEIERRCAADERVDATVSYVVDSDESGATRARVEGPLPGPVLACVESVLASVGPRIGRGIDRGHLSLGAITPETMAFRRGINQSKLEVVDAGATAGAVVVRRVTSTSSGGLVPQLVQRVMRRSFPRFRHCYARDQHPAKKGKVTLRFEVGPVGDVTTMAATAADVAASTALCVGDAVRSLKFPAPDGGQRVKVNYTLGFEQPR